MDGLCSLRSWLINNGGFINNKISVEFLPNIGFGLKANAPISPYETLCVVPLRTCLRSASTTTEESLQHICTELLLEQERAASSFYAPFLSVLPKDNSFLPSLWPTARMARIQGTSLAEDALNMKESWQMQIPPGYSTIPNDVGKEKLIWARSTLQCRAFSFNIPSHWDRDSFLPVKVKQECPEASKLVVFFPFISLANHDDKKFCTVSLGDASKYGSSSVVLHTDYQRYKAGEVICISYGELSFQQKLLSFGWVDRSVDSALSFSIVPLTIPNSAGRQLEIKCRIVSNRGKAKLRPAVIQSELSKAKRVLREFSLQSVTTPCLSPSNEVAEVYGDDESAEALLQYLLLQRRAVLESASSREGIDWRSDDSHYVAQLSDEQYIVYVETRAVDLLLAYILPLLGESTS